jgi:flagellar hook-length control protein FliK
MWMNARNIQTAELHLNPADLGPIDVRIQIGAEQSSISFNSQNQSVRELLEANIHRLREMLNNPGQSENGQSGGGAFAQDSGTQSQGQSGGESLGHRSAMASASDVVDGESRSSSRSTGAESTLVDAYV